MRTEKRRFKVGDYVMLYAKVTWVSSDGKALHIMTDGGNHIDEATKDLYSPARPIGLRGARRKKI